MVGSFSDFASTFLIVLAIGSTILLGVPLFLRPLLWARVLRWPLPAETDLAIYFGRCLGAVVLVLATFAIVAAGNPAVQPFFFGIAIANFSLMILVHAWGALRGIQPWTETAEIAIWVGLLVVAVLSGLRGASHDLPRQDEQRGCAAQGGPEPEPRLNQMIGGVSLV